MLAHTEEPDMIQVIATSCPATAVVELARFSYCRTYTAPEGDLLEDAEGCVCPGCVCCVPRWPKIICCYLFFMLTLTQ